LSAFGQLLESQILNLALDTPQMRPFE